jgi:hypothetical protein
MDDRMSPPGGRSSSLVADDLFRREGARLAVAGNSIPATLTHPLHQIARMAKVETALRDLLDL